MQFIIKAYDGEGMLEKRMEIRSRHFEGIDKIRHHVICAGAIRDEAGKMIGSLLVMEYESREELDQYIANEPYAQEHVWERIEIEPMTVAILDGEKTSLWPTDSSIVDYIWHYPSPLGGITLSSDGEALTGLWFDGQKFFGTGLDARNEEKRLPIFDETCRWLDIYFSGKAPDFTPDLNVHTTPFRKAICGIMLDIPYGQTMSYGEIARRYARQAGLERMSSQAVGNAVAHNPISIIIPCHRVVGTDGSLTGYAAGLDRKLQLLKLERSAK